MLGTLQISNWFTFGWWSFFSFRQWNLFFWDRFLWDLRHFKETVWYNWGYAIFQSTLTEEATNDTDKKHLYDCLLSPRIMTLLQETIFLKKDLENANEEIFVPFTGGASFFFGTDTGTFFSGIGFLGTSGTLKIAFCLKEWTPQRRILCTTRTQLYCKNTYPTQSSNTN